MLNFKYWAIPEEKEKLTKLYTENERKTHEKYSADKLFVDEENNFNRTKFEPNKNVNDYTNLRPAENMIPVKSKQNVFIRVINKIKSILLHLAKR